MSSRTRATTSTDNEIAILHDQIRAIGGAELVAFELARTFDCPIYAGFVDETLPPDDVEVREVFDSRVGQRLMQSHYLVQDVYQMLAWQHVEDLYEFDTLVINKTNPGWFVPRDTQTTVWYLHSTPRGQYDQFHSHGKSFISRMVKTPMRPLYRPNIAYADSWACNSELVERRMNRYWDVDSDDIDVIYPPVDLDGLSPDRDETGDYYATISRLREHKRIDEIIQAFDGRDERLVIAGDGPDRERLEEMAPDNVDILGFVPEEEKARLLAGAKAGIFAAENEDFGLVPCEFFASGTPVLGIRDGYTQYQIADGENGLLFDRGELETAVDRFETEGVDWTDEEIHDFADRFSAERFQTQMREVVARAREESEVTVPWDDSDGITIEFSDEAEPAIPDGGDAR